MRPDEIRAHVRREPFRPIRIYISDGSSHDVRHPELMFVSRTEVVIGLDAGDDELPERSVSCDPLRITGIEPVDAAPSDRRT